MDIYFNFLWIVEGIVLLKRHIQVYLQRRDNDKVLSLFLSVVILTLMSNVYIWVMGGRKSIKGFTGIQIVTFAIVRYWLQGLYNKILSCKVCTWAEKKKQQEKKTIIDIYEKLFRMKWCNILINEVRILALSCMDFAIIVLLLLLLNCEYVNGYVDYLLKCSYFTKALRNYILFVR